MHHRSLPFCRPSSSFATVVVPLSLIAATCTWLGLTSFACRSNPVVVAGPDTTSHAFTWEVTTLGGTGGSSALYDVAIINDTLAYAVGEIYVEGDYTPYNVAVWNGQTWDIKRLTYLGGYAPISALFAFTKDDIWFGIGYAIHWNGSSYQEVEIPGFHSRVNRMWGTSSSDLYVVGNAGDIRHYDGTSWTKIESGSTLDFVDIWGDADEVLAVCTRNYPIGRGIFRIGPSNVTTLSLYPIDEIAELFGLWFVSGKHYYVVGSGIYEKHTPNDTAWINSPLQITRCGVTHIRGMALNDVVAVGVYGECLHWNGATWRSYQNVTSLTNGSFTSVAMSNKRVFAVGSSGRQAVVAMGTR